jgi:hypothetical protein
LVEVSESAAIGAAVDTPCTWSARAAWALTPGLAAATRTVEGAIEVKSVAGCHVALESSTARSTSPGCGGGPDDTSTAGPAPPSVASSRAPPVIFESR